MGELMCYDKWITTYSWNQATTDLLPLFSWHLEQVCSIGQESRPVLVAKEYNRSHTSGGETVVGGQ